MCNKSVDEFIFDNLELIDLEHNEELIQCRFGSFNSI